MDTSEYYAERLQTFELSLKDVKDDVSDASAHQGLAGQTISGGGIIRGVAWDFPKGGATETPPPAAWSVRVTSLAQEDGTVSHRREIFSPLWRTKEATHVAEGCAEGAWSALPEGFGAEGKILYAVLKLTVAAATYEQTAWELKLTEDIENLHDTPIVPPNPNATGASGTDGVYHLIVPIGQWDTGASTFAQWHVGVISEDFHPRRTLQEQTVVAGVELSGNGQKLNVFRKRVLVPLPLGKTPEPDPEEVELPSGGAGSLALGPMEFVDGKFVQYVGRWSFEDGKWTFTKENTVAAVTYGTLQGTFRGGYNNGTLSSGAMPNFGDVKPVDWLTMQTVDIFTGLEYTPPADETGNGSMDGTSKSFTYLGTAPAKGESKRLLRTIVEDANEQTTYEDAGGGQ